MSTDESCMLADVDAMESTPCELHVEHLHKGALSELSAISATPATPAQVDPVGKTEEQQLKVYLRVRPFSKEEISNNEDQGCVVLESAEVAVLQAPKESLTMKNSEKGIGQAMHKFSFSQIFGPETTQTNFFESTVRSLVFNYLAGQNALVFTYGVTNAGKTHTIQGSVQDPGILPRALDLIFNHIKGKQYEQMDLKPYLGSDVQYLDSEQVQMEKSTKAAVFALLKEENDPSLKAGGSATAMKSMSKSPSTASLSFSSVSYDQSGLFDSTDSEQDTSKFSVWVCFFEIYNECVYDLLDLIPTSKGKKRNALRVCEDTSGNSYVRGLKWIYVQNTEEACKILKIGNKNRSAASTKMNQSSSRSHSIFTIKLLRIQGTEVQKISELSLCDLAGSERCNKTKTFGERLKEAGNINNSLLILGKCISALRQNQNVKTKNSYVPFRESKLTRLFQSIFCGKGRACMIVNINQCASTYDETLHVMKFSAVAKQVVQIITPKTLESIAPRLVGRDGKPLVKNGVIDNEALESYLSEEELLDEDDDDEADMSILPQEELLNIIESLKEKLLVERRRNLVQEIEIRKEMGDAMLQQLMESEETRSRQIEELKDSYEEKLENTFDMYKDAIKEHAYQCALERVEDEYVPVEEFLEEQKHVEELQKKLAETAHRLKAFQDPLAPQTMESSTRCSPETDIAVLNENQALSEANSLSERLHEQKDEIIKSLKKKIDEMNETLQEAGESFREKEAEIKDFLERILQQDQAIERLQSSNSELEIVVSQLREDLQRLNQLSKEVSEQPRPKRGLLANIKASVSSPVKLPLSRTLKKSVKSTPRSTQKMAL
ncbi:kinesin-like protein KIF20A [Amia ocellicauda]|uniref:kinesin-like protein KIF20A n=1 Tax=Amia ocellicauda TaxID=2972642 RepID=UPI00346386E4